MGRAVLMGAILCAVCVCSGCGDMMKGEEEDTGARSRAVDQTRVNNQVVRDRRQQEADTKQKLNGYVEAAPNSDIPESERNIQFEPEE